MTQEPSRSGQDLVTCTLRTCLIWTILAAARAVFTRISGVPHWTPDAARTSDRDTRCVPLTVTERTTSSGELNRTQAAVPITPTAARAKNAARQPRRLCPALTPEVRLSPAASSGEAAPSLMMPLAPVTPVTPQGGRASRPAAARAR